MDPMKKLMTIPFALMLLVAPTVAADDDEIPDPVESELCGRPAIRDAFDDLDGQAGECASSTDYVAPDPTPVILGLVDEAQSLVDEDRDLVLDALEPTICSVENQNEDYDGSCSGMDYTYSISETFETIHEPLETLCVYGSPIGTVGICYSSSAESHRLMFGVFAGPFLPF